MSKTEMAVLFLSLGALALSAATLLGANSLTSRLGERLELFHRRHTALQTEVSTLNTNLGSVESRLDCDWLRLRRSPELRVAELLRERQVATVILVRAPQSLDSRFVFLVRAQTKRMDEAAKSLYRLDADVLLVECHQDHDEAMLQADRICALIQPLGLVVAEIRAPSPARWAIDQALTRLLTLPPQERRFLLVQPS